MTNVRFFSNYDTSADLLKRFKANYEIDDDDLHFTVNDDYNVAVLFNRADEGIKPWAKTITVIQEPSWSKAHEFKHALMFSDYLIIHDKELFERVHKIKLGGYVMESPSYMFYHDHVPWEFFSGTEAIKKTRKLSIIISGSGSNSLNGNYRKRLAVLGKILESDLDIDIYGKKLDIQDERYKGVVDYKYTALIPYEYSIAIENSNEKNYITEKFFDCVLCNTTPIYNGAPNIKEVYDERYFRTIDLDSATLVDDIKKIIAFPAPGSIKNKEIYRSRFNLYSRLKEIIFNELL